MYGTNPKFQPIEALTLESKKIDSYHTYCGYYDACKVAVICQITHLINNHTIKDKTLRNLQYDFDDIFFKNFVNFDGDTVTPIGNYGRYFPIIA
jgi:phosphopentomutase